MNRSKRASAVLPLLLVAVIVGGCAKSDLHRAYQYEAGLILAQDTLVRLHNAGAISDKQFAATEPDVQAARAAIDQAKANARVAEAVGTKLPPTTWADLDDKLRAVEREAKP